MGRKAYRRGITTTSTTLSDLGEIGDFRRVGNKSYKLCYAKASQASKALLMLESTDTTLSSFILQSMVASTDTVYGANDTGASLATGTYFWALVEGPFVVDSTNVDTDADIAVQAELYLNSDKSRMCTTIVSTAISLGHSLAAITSVESLVGTPTVYLKGLGA